MTSLFDHAIGQGEYPQPPPLPTVVRYWNDYEQKHETLRALTTGAWLVASEGQKLRIEFEGLPAWQLCLWKAVVVDLLVTRAAKTAFAYHSALRALPDSLLQEVFDCIAYREPAEFRVRWIAEFREQLGQRGARAIRYVLACACKWSFGKWMDADRDLVRGLPGYSLDKYKAVREGSCFLPTHDQSLIVGYLDDIAARALRQNGSAREFRDAAMLALAYQYGLRRGQIARITRHDVRCHNDGSLHVKVRLLKQRGERRGQIVVRAVQKSWAPLITAWMDRSVGEGDDKLFGPSPAYISVLIRCLTEDITGSAYSTRDLRHTAAQRLVDGGTSRAALSEFLGHTDLTAADVYFEGSPKQAELVSAALGLSEVYRDVVAVAQSKNISAAELACRPNDEQISGMPHGVPISGIGACQTGQSSCQRNPVLACYTCHKFLPLDDSQIHQKVLDDFQGIVRQFDQPNRVDRVSPAMLQLRHTLEAVRKLAVDVSDESRR